MLSKDNAAIDAVYRSDWGANVATLIRLVGDFDLADRVASRLRAFHRA
jgi:predicted RNA polymerase sigma factor